MRASLIQTLGLRSYRQPIYMIGRLWKGGLGARPQKNFEVSHALKCVLGASEAPFCACIQYIRTCKLPSSFSGCEIKKYDVWGPS